MSTTSVGFLLFLSKTSNELQINHFVCGEILVQVCTYIVVMRVSVSLVCPSRVHASYATYVCQRVVASVFGPSL